MLLKYFDLYTLKGMQIIPVYKNSKVPVGKNWNRNWNKEKCREMIATGNYNLGILLGDIVDVEGDTPEANDLLTRMIDGLPHPMYRSSRSIHHLFINPDPHLTATRFQDIEFRGQLHQSVLPPSTHEDGTGYLWLRGTSLDIPDMPQELRDFYFKNRREVRPRYFFRRGPKPLPHGLKKTTCSCCGKVEVIHKKRLMLEVRAFAEHHLPWMCHCCRKMDVREACRRIRQTLEQPKVVIFASS
jgi:hypothetical protein